MSDPSKNSLTPTKATHVPNVQTTSLGPEPATIPYGVKLNGVNYSLRSQVVETSVVGRRKLGYFTGNNPEPSTDGALYDKWSMENAM
ncbi:hypothetical protein SESBI_04886 [Sesbania bispinosa]|nr:hypothetical protein SESBI_04886 [Sesbania bispinosa]